MVVFLIRIVVEAVDDDILDTEHLEVNLHDQSPLRVIGPRDIGHETFADGRSTMRSMTRDPVSRGREWRLWERPR
jgi:hypothetical protein